MKSVNFATAPSKPSPASTLTASRSSASGSDAPISSLRLRIFIVSSPSGAKNPHAENARMKRRPVPPLEPAPNSRASRRPPTTPTPLNARNPVAVRRRPRPADRIFVCTASRLIRGLVLSTSAGDPVAQRQHHALAEPNLTWAGADAELPVAGCPLHGELALPAGLGDEVADEVDGGPEAHQCENEQHRLITP